MVLSSGFLTDLRITHRRVGWEIWLSMASSYQRVTYPMGLTWLAERSSNFKVLQDQQIWFPQIWWWGCRDYKGLHRVGSSCPLLESNGLHFPQICTIWHLKTSRFRRHHWGWRLEVIFFSGGWVDPKGGKHWDDKINSNTNDLWWILWCLTGSLFVSLGQLLGLRNTAGKTQAQLDFIFANIRM